MRTSFRAALLVFTTLFTGVAYAQTGTPRGRVESTSGAAVSGATVRASLRGGPAVTGTTTAEGAYEIAGLAPGRYSVAASAAGFTSASREGVDIASGQTVTLVAFRLASVRPPEPAGFTVSGTVVDNVTRQPIGGAIVGLQIGEGRRLTADTTGRDGAFTVTVSVVERALLTLRVEAPGYLPVSLPAGVTAARLVVGLTSASGATSTVFGAVRANGQPVAGARVRLVRVDPLSLPLALERTTGATGTYRFDSLRAGSYILTAEATGYRPAATDVRLGAGQRLERNFEFRTAEPPAVRAEVTGRVVTDGTRTPVAGARVTLYAAQDSGAVRPAATGETDREGRFTVRVAPGRYVSAVRVSGERGVDAYTEFYRDARTPAEAAVLSVGTLAPTNIEFSVPSAPARVSVRVQGRVTDAAGAPLANAVVTIVQQRSTGPLAAARTGADGAYDVRFEATAPLALLVSARREGYETEYYREAATEAAATPVSITTAPFTAENVSFTLAVRGVSTGTLVGSATRAADGSAVSGATVHAYSPERRTTTTTGVDGRYSFATLPFASYVVLGTAEGLAPTYAGSRTSTWLDATRVLIGPTMGPAVPTANLALAPFTSPGGRNRIAGKAMTREGRPVAGALMRAFDAARRLAAWTFSDERGGYELAGLDSGRHVVTVEVPFTGVWGETVELDTSAAVQGVANFVVTTGGGATATEAAAVPGALRLETPAPNPARGAVVLRYVLGEAQPVMLRVYDALGRAVATVDAGLRVAGAHDVAFDAGTLAPGLYVLRLDAGGARHTQTLVVAR